MKEECIICYDTYTTGVVTECGHRCCLKCGLRYKFISNKSGCPICLREVADEELLFRMVRSPGERFINTEESYIWANSIVCKPEEIEEIEGLLTRSCKLCKTEFYDSETLMAHYTAKHKRYLCELCVQYRCEFPSEYIVYSLAELNTHRTEKTIGNGHPSCGFCRERFYTPEILMKHCRKAHELCYLCERLGKKNEYYKNYKELEGHFKKAHYTCDEKMCLDARCYAFIDEIELAAHKVSTHPVKKERIRIPILSSVHAHKKTAVKEDVYKKGRNPNEPGNESSAESAPQDRNTPEVPKHLNREELLKKRNMKEKYTNMISRSYTSPRDVVLLTEKYDRVEIGLDEFVGQIRAILGDTKTIEFIERVSTYLMPDRTEDIKVNFPKIRRSIEFAPTPQKSPHAKNQPQKSAGSPQEQKKEESPSGYTINPQKNPLECAYTTAHKKDLNPPKQKPALKVSWSSAHTISGWSNKPGAATKPTPISKIEIKLPTAIKKDSSKAPNDKETAPTRRHRVFEIK
ncbi:E3 ubiquitin-protein ligase [Nematocida parisii]|uniref:uncharacterized protein n=1 Tax=Nematocida parisii (strain ERTm1 / ATCC PRA-289) TaxID=881290 RepID=UPI000264B1DE|nr:uncharacterized protein NEPG_02075 [Nematocida parisii ERTm1]EIJ93119.1 hypothetical protein NEPG_02075 [Nematocida parisii ERTm1]KAI5157265.1 E3 ubiquitin-protein ligase [Nematocida parisii]|eukprot:XP_013059902.1 hypothetical protein NEPG_02075 [Nematocida parisii ERTm1]